MNDDEKGERTHNRTPEKNTPYLIHLSRDLQSIAPHHFQSFLVGETTAKVGETGYAA